MADLPIACELSPAEYQARQTDLLPALAATAREWQERPDGLALRFDAAREQVIAVARTIDLERRCCRFLRFQLTVEPGEGPMWLEITGPPGTRDFLRELLGR